VSADNLAKHVPAGTPGEAVCCPDGLGSIEAASKIQCAAWLRSPTRVPFPRLWWKTSASNRDKPLLSAAWWETYANQVSVSRSTANSRPIQLRDHAWGKISKPRSRAAKTLADAGQYLVGGIEVGVHVLDIVRVFQSVNDLHQLFSRRGVDLLGVLRNEGDLG
jgi:hypothetical protein